MLAISVETLVVTYRQAFRPPVKAVDGLSFSVEEAEIVGFVGLNGAGKTSTIKALMGFQPADSGVLELFGREVRMSEGRDDVGFLPETAIYSPYLTPSETLRLYGNLAGMSGRELEQRIVELLELVKVPEKAKLLNRTLSKGMLQRVGIAQALLSRPKLLILDEVSSGLDPVGRRDLRDLLLAQRASGATIFFSSHDLWEVEAICDRVLVIDKGKIIANREVKRLKEEVGSIGDYFVSLVGDERRLEPTAKA